MSRGFTLIELVIGLAVAGTVALVLAAMIQGGTKVYLFTVRQSAALASARKSLIGDGKKLGLVPAAQEADSVVSVSTTSLALSPLSGSSTTYLLVSNALYSELGAAQTLVAENVVDLTPQYYGLSAAGLIEATTTPASALLVTVLVQTQATAPQSKIDSFYSGARLRTGP